jgi:L-ascorbate metabolism protein UlaG (beta-lactamase superfamily)
MKARCNPTLGWSAAFVVSLVCGPFFNALLCAQTPPEFTAIQPLTNKEVRLLLNAPTGRGYRIDASTELSAWSSLVTLTGATTSLQFTDSAAPYFSTRYYRAEQLSLANLITGDHLATTNGDAIILPVGHASFVMSWNGLMIYNDPTGGAAPYASVPRADLILVSHSHGDHFEASTLTAVRKTNGIIIAPIGVYNHTSMTPTLRSNTIVLGSGIFAGSYPTVTNVLGVSVQAVAGTNANHTSGLNNAYVVTIGGKRLFMSGDTGNTAEIRAVQDIDVAFLCMNTPFTMGVNDATNCIRAMRPKVVYPYHYRNQDGTTTNAAAFKQRLGPDLGIEVRLRKWY